MPIKTNKHIETLLSVSVVVLNWNGKEFIDLFLPSLVKQDYPKDKLDIVFVDNCSGDNSVDHLKENYKDVDNLRLVNNKNNYGYAKGNNEGIKTCKSDYILVCNNDLELDKSAISKMVDCAKSRKADLVVPKLLYYKNRSVINNAGSRLDPDSNWPIYEIGTNEIDSQKYNKIYEISAFCGACVLFKRSFLETVGLYDSKFFMYFEDGDLSWRGQKSGKKYFYQPDAVVYHYHTGTSTEGSPLFNYFVGRNRMLILTKNARLKVILSGWKATLRDHFVNRFKNLILSIGGKYGKKLAFVEFIQSFKMMLAAIYYTPYALLKRYNILKEEKL